jgi:hypothetical protein
MKKSSEQLQNISQLTTNCLTQNIVKIKKAFPNLTEDFYDLLCERLKAHNFTDKQLEDSVNNVIDTCLYPIPTVGNFIFQIKKRSCPFDFKFGEDFDRFCGCEECHDNQHKVWFDCKITKRKENE